MKVILMAVVMLMAASCGPMNLKGQRQAVSSGFIGCAPEEIEISDNQSYTWTASCKGKKFFCDVGGRSGMCTPELK